MECHCYDRVKVNSDKKCITMFIVCSVIVIQSIFVLFENILLHDFMWKVQAFLLPMASETPWNKDHLYNFTFTFLSKHNTATATATATMNTTLLPHFSQLICTCTCSCTCLTID